MQVTVFGAAGKTGEHVVRLLRKRGETVVAFVHRHDPFEGLHGVRRVRGDVRDPAAVQRAIKGSDAVISCVGSWKSRHKDILTATMQSLVPAMERQGVSRIISLTGADAQAPYEETNELSWLRPMLVLFAGKIVRDGEEHMRLLADSSLDWTVLRSPIMNNRGAKGYTLTNAHGNPFATIRREAVATALVDQLYLTNAYHSAPLLARSLISPDSRVDPL